MRTFAALVHISHRELGAHNGIMVKEVTENGTARCLGFEFQINLIELKY